MVNQQNTMDKRKSGRMTGQAYSLQPVMLAVRPIVKKILPQKSVVFQQLFEIWPDIVASTDAKSSIPEKLTFPRGEQKDGCLSIWAQSGAQAMEISYIKGLLIQRINAVFGFCLVADIKVTAHPSKIAVPATPVIKRLKRGIPSQSLDKMLGGMSNPQLKATLGELGSFLDPETIENTYNKGETNA
ncbi:MAG: hypothetical protein JWM96_1122 [Alphaproteobacteria bacterium]|nr:hypothetical protein [Alphaproteobacteria bacterium]